MFTSDTLNHISILEDNLVLFAETGLDRDISANILILMTTKAIKPYAGKWIDLYNSARSINLREKPVTFAYLVNKILTELRSIKGQLTQIISEVQPIFKSLILRRFTGIDSCLNPPKFDNEINELSILVNKSGEFFSIPELTEIAEKILAQMITNYIEDILIKANPNLVEDISWDNFALAYNTYFREDTRFQPLVYDIALKYLKNNHLLTMLEFKSLLNYWFNETKIRNNKQPLVNYVESKSQAISINEIDVMSGVEFERFLKNLFEILGYSVTITNVTGDQGGDLVLSRFGIRTLVQAKRYASSVGNWAVQEVVAGKALYECTESIVVTNNSFTKSAIELAQANYVQLWDRKFLQQIIGVSWNNAFSSRNE